ncbi:Hypothetical predicted protein [Podarcis lilfordi]|uniref:Uncharacterized protein n=1 Tax=Podarcis lilfordi TaxID=74358 RepID=A0AA35KWI9_9SAUR|nr:Hypothetical predicted protein [Podarcis lilfordi]
MHRDGEGAWSSKMKCNRKRRPPTNCTGGEFKACAQAATRRIAEPLQGRRRAALQASGLAARIPASVTDTHARTRRHASCPFSCGKRQPTPWPRPPCHSLSLSESRIREEGGSPALFNSSRTAALQGLEEGSGLVHT